MSNQVNQVEAISNQIEERIAEMPQQVLDLILNEVSGSTMVGASLRANDSEALKERLSTMDMRDMSKYAERLIHASQALEHSELAHTPHTEGLLQVIDGTAGVAYNSSANEEEQEAAFYRGLQQVAAVIPGVQSDGSPLAMEKIYETAPDDAFDGNSVLEMAREELGNPSLPDDERTYWEDTVKRMVPELRDKDTIHPDDVPMEEKVAAAREGAELHNAELGKASGQLLNTLYGSNRAEVQEGSDQSYLTDPETRQQFRDTYGLDNSDDSDTDDGDLALGVA